ncbi:hypothetical protein [Algoriphagus litoralis]|uniref:hypothetical protein n=1 Tax=Algoriphagus litoralis TaxID=2202829 RepID=UPI000DB9A030|nr:hypothetical protein [Algoriphagus litoralis]
MKQALILILLAAVFGCTDTSDQPIPLTLEGIWVDQLTKTDTLEFLTLQDGSSLLNLKRGQQNQNGFAVPKIGSGLYTFSIKKDNITLQYSLSSYYNPTEYYFRQNALELKIGRFFDSENSSDVLTFRKVR